MTVRIMVVARKRAGLGMAEFRAYYRDRHLPFMHRLLDHGAAVHRRHFVVHDASPHPGDADVITEALYEDETILERTIAELQEPEKRRLRLEDEAHFLDPDSVRILRVETETTVFRPLPETAE